MKISRDWLSDYIDWKESDPQTIAEGLTCGMGEVDDVVLQGQYLDHCVVGKILSVEKHPDADKLSVCTVQTDQGKKTVVCGGTNVRPEMLVAFAHIGATVLWHGGESMTLSSVKIRGVESHGMICAQEELGLTQFPPQESDGPRPIVDLSAVRFPLSIATVGAPLRQALGMNDVIFHIDNHAITNRPDLFSHIGIARELVAMGFATWKKRSAAKKILFPKTASSLKCINEIPHLIPRYCACTLSIDAVGTTPDWMKRRLEATGWRSVNLPVDITNYVAMETGMPLHSFDMDDIQGTVRMTTAKKNETIVTLDEEKRTLSEGAIVLRDEKGVFDLLGIMGGLRSSTKETTRNIYLHAAIVDPVSIRRAVIAMGHRTDAATVYEKGIPRASAELGFMRALELFLELVPGARITSKMESFGKNETKKAVVVPAERIDSIIGVKIKPATVKKILSDLGCNVKSLGKKLSVTPPVWRNDIRRAEDIVEEVARIHGYANIPAEMAQASILPPHRDQRINVCRDALKEDDYTELLNLSFASPGLLKKCGLEGEKTVTIENPLGEELSHMRPSLLPAILHVVGRELPRAASFAKVFEYGNVFSPGNERPELTLVVAARGKTSIKDDPLLLLKADLTHAMQSIGYVLNFAQETKGLPTFAHAGRSAIISCNGDNVGLLTEIHPAIRTNFGISARAATATLNLEKLFAKKTAIPMAVPLAAFPSIDLDETLPLPKSPYAGLVRRLYAVDSLLKNIGMVDLYESESTKTMTLRFTYRADDRTLTQEEVERIHGKVLNELKK